MSEVTLSVIPTDPRWQPTRAAAERAIEVLERLAPPTLDGNEPEINWQWHQMIAVVHPGSNLEWVGCPHCGASIDLDWWGQELVAHYQSEAPTLATKVPCCGTDTSLDALEYAWPCGFARFELVITSPGRSWFSPEELSAVAEALGHPVRQVMACD